MTYDPNYYPGCNENMPHPVRNTARYSMGANNGYWGGDEEVTGIIIGEGDTRRLYQFWTEGDEPSLLCSTKADTDAEAIEWFKTHWPVYFKAGAEMRVFN